MIVTGRISYTNDLPIYAGIDAGAVHFPWPIESDIPTRLNRALFEGELAISPISSFFYAQHADRFVLLPELCIASDGPVMSVVLLSEKRPELLENAVVIVPPDSASARNLLELLFVKRYGVRTHFVEAPDPLTAARESGNPALLIGDRAIDALLDTPPAHVYDLGELWRRWTNEMMVFAVWAVRRDVARSRPADVEAAAHALLASYRWAQRHRPDVLLAAGRMRPRPAGFYDRYYRILEFDFNDRARRGLARFYCELAACGLLNREPKIDFLEVSDAVA